MVAGQTPAPSAVPAAPTSVSIYGAGQLGTSVAGLLRANPRYEVRGPFGRTQRAEALGSGADLVIVATTTRLADVLADVEAAVDAGSNVLVTAEEAAYPFMVDREGSERVAALARERGVTVAGGGVNPGLMFDSLVLTMLGAAPRGCNVLVRRIVDISGFGSTVLRRIGVGATEPDFLAAVQRGEILGHAGFPQSMTLVAAALGLTIDRIDRVLLPIITDVDIDLPGKFLVRAGESAGVDQTYTAIVDGRAWFTSHFYGHVALRAIGREPTDDIDLTHRQAPFQSIRLRPGVNAQVGSQNMVANSVERIIAARPGGAPLAELAPAFPAPMG